MDWGDILGAGISLYSASQSKDAAKDAASAQVSSSQDSIDFSKWLYEQQTELQKPYYDTGVSVLPMLQARAGVIPTAGTAPKLQQIPRYSAEQAAGLDNIYDYVSNLYIEGLGREGTQENIENWVSRIATGELDKQSVVNSFMSEADKNNIQYDRDKLSGIQNAVGVASSPMATTNYFNSYSPSSGDGVYGGSSSNSGVNTSSLGANSALGGFSFSGVKDAISTYGKSAFTGLVTGGLFGAGLAVAGQSIYDSFMGNNTDKDTSNPDDRMNSYASMVKDNPTLSWSDFKDLEKDLGLDGATATASKTITGEGWGSFGEAASAYGTDRGDNTGAGGGYGGEGYGG